MENLDAVDYSIISELLKNSRISDRGLAKKLGVSQPTVTRRRVHIEKEKLLEYTAIPNFGELRLVILAITFASWDHKVSPDEKVSEAQKFLSEHPNIIFVSTGRGLHSDRVCISLHKNYADYTKLLSEFRTEWEKYFTILDSFVISLKGDNILRTLTFKHLGKYLKQQNKTQ